MSIKARPTHSYSLRWEPNDPTTTIIEPPAQEPSEEMVTVMPFPLNIHGEASHVDEWDTLLNDMIAFSKTFPNRLFAIYCKEWTENDDWVAYFLNGYYQEQSSEITYRPPAEGKWT